MSTSCGKFVVQTVNFLMKEKRGFTEKINILRKMYHVFRIKDLYNQSLFRQRVCTAIGLNYSFPEMSNKINT
jgi:hypothetical protein